MTVLALPRRNAAPGGTRQGLRLAPDPCELSRARDFAEAAAERFGLSPREQHDFKLAASEAVANAIEHGLPCADGAIHVWTSEEEHTLTLGVRNAGEFIFTPPPTDPLAERGRGLVLIGSLVDVAALTRVGDDVVIELVKRRQVGAMAECGGP
jgi:anti-sigma regulatory factor (Ser/Thr protein kinase)